MYHQKIIVEFAIDLNRAYIKEGCTKGFCLTTFCTAFSTKLPIYLNAIAALTAFFQPVYRVSRSSSPISGVKARSMFH